MSGRSASLRRARSGSGGDGRGRQGGGRLKGEPHVPSTPDGPGSSSRGSAQNEINSATVSWAGDTSWGRVRPVCSAQVEISTWASGSVDTSCSPPPPGSMARPLAASRALLHQCAGGSQSPCRSCRRRALGVYVSVRVRTVAYPCLVVRWAHPEVCRGALESSGSFSRTPVLDCEICTICVGRTAQNMNTAS